jgi:xanthine dehydrogenase accessory factor
VNKHLSELLSALQALAPLESAVLVSVQSVQGSAPRDVGAWMAVFQAHPPINTLGGGQLEFQALQVAGELLRDEAKPWAEDTSMPRMSLDGSSALVRRFPLGPSLGQCCGGVVHLKFEKVWAKDQAHLAQRLQTQEPRLALFGAGHVGRALMRVMCTLPWQLSWIDSREEMLLEQEFPNVVMEHSEPVQMAVDHLSAQSHVLIMSFSHAEDLDILARCLHRQRLAKDLASLGLIGSQTKWATFQNRLRERGFTQEELDQVECPIGLPDIQGKEPEVIALSVAARMLQLQEKRAGQVAQSTVTA